MTVEDINNKIDEVTGNIEKIKEIKMIKDNEDGTKEYLIVGKDEEDLRKEIFEKFAKENITIFEMKKKEITLEDAFMKLISNKQKGEE